MSRKRTLISVNTERPQPDDPATDARLLDMTHTFHARRFVRRWAAVLAVLWLLVVGVNVAHACIVGLAIQPEVAQPAMGHGHSDPVTSKTDCQNFCEKSSLASLAKTSWDSPAAHIPLLPPQSVLTIASIPGDDLMPATSSSPAPIAPVFIRFLRLTL